MATARISLDSPVFAGRLRAHTERVLAYERRPIQGVRPRLMQDVRVGSRSAKAQKAASKKLHAPVRSSLNVRTTVAPPQRTTKSNVLRRSIVRAPAHKRKTRRFRLSSKKILLALGIMLFLFGVGVGLDGLRANKEVIAQVQSIQQNNTAAGVGDTGETGESDGGAVAAAAIPAEDDRPNLDAYRVAADLPRALYIPKLDVKARVMHLGVTRDGAIAAPSNVLDAGWYKQSAKPGQPGAVLIDGHVHGPTKPGVFVDLKKLKSGDEIQLERGDGTRLTYKVVESKTYPADNVDMEAALRSVRSGKQGLNIVTCTGQIDKATNKYKDRLVVFAEQK